MRTTSRRSASRPRLAGPLGSRPAGRPAAAAGPRVLTGTLDGVEYTIEVPQPGNGTLLRYRHGGVRPGAPNPAVHRTHGPPASGPSWDLGEGYPIGPAHGRA